MLFKLKSAPSFKEKSKKILRGFAPNLTRMKNRIISRYGIGDLSVMRKFITIIPVLFMLSISNAVAGDTTDRVVDSVLGGLGGALIGGPLGFVAGAATGATAGPAISHAWGLEGGGASSSKKRAVSSVRQTGAHKASTNLKPRSMPAMEEDI